MRGASPALPVLANPARPSSNRALYRHAATHLVPQTRERTVTRMTSGGAVSAAFERIAYSLEHGRPVAHASRARRDLLQHAQACVCHQLRTGRNRATPWHAGNAQGTLEKSTTIAKVADDLAHSVRPQSPHRPRATALSFKSRATYTGIGCPAHFGDEQREG
ncbi:hypothetical protein BD310DRAFT_939012 [Dichomitus squalens]|uniref:Uncharacterized protein n=1 Tax=Dichomitus squalens TaxID=114155 RepID=A0A4Q9PFJ0_9APHY|nr:hypothetical protein BD310DRAFT_939012 [Dichomitus squalens]